MKVTNNELSEIYTFSEESFSVGICIYEDDNIYVYKTVDTYGILTGYFMVKKNIIRHIDKDTEYLKVIEAYLEYARDHSYKDWFELRHIAFEGDVINQILKIAYEDDLIITVRTNESDNIYEGYIELYDSYMIMRCIDLSNAKYLETKKIEIEDVVCISFFEIDQILLDFAFKEMNL